MLRSSLSDRRVGGVSVCEVLNDGGYIAPGSGPVQLGDFKLVADTPVAGTVKDAQGHLLAGTAVETNFIGNHDGITDADGGLELRGLPANGEVPDVDRCAGFRVRRADRGLSGTAGEAADRAATLHLFERAGHRF